ncbi:hypothetical protein EVAR_67543_1 [Eumeta japonica]|uniref:Uncharacterized protein n=1 Tax=Eumeta variegata TaxID=151549 RepID=A0A4C1ZXN7_EUMVA|nr:hypothetical protein EVAR_67543_1 [Eumeta japonica]
MMRHPLCATPNSPSTSSGPAHAGVSESRRVDSMRTTARGQRPDTKCLITMPFTANENANMIYCRGVCRDDNAGYDSKLRESEREAGLRVARRAASGAAAGTASGTASHGGWQSTY